MREFAGFQFPEQENEIVDYLRRSGGVYQPVHRRRSLEYVTDYSRAVDVGAHVGLWSRDLAGRFQHVLAFEPLAINRECLEQNVPRDVVDIMAMALGNHHGAVSMEVPEELTTGPTRIAVERKGWIPIGRLDDFELDSLGYIKIDVEGFELQVLKGAEQTLRRHQPIVIVEQKGFGHEHFGETERYAAVRYLEGLGAEVLDRIVDDFIMGWPATPGRVRAVEPLPFDDKLATTVRCHNAGDFVGAEIGYHCLLKDEPENADLWHLLACANCQQEKVDRAISLMDRALALAPQCGPFHRSLGVFLLQAGRTENARASFGKACQLDPADATSAAHLQQLGQAESAQTAGSAATRIDVAHDTPTKPVEVRREGTPQATAFHDQQHTTES